MSRNITNNKHFLELLLSTSKQQALALLYTATNQQILLLSEIAHNILQLPLPKKAEHYVTKRKKLFEALANTKRNLALKRSSIDKNADYILQVLLALKQQLSALQ